MEPGKSRKSFYLIFCIFLVVIFSVFMIVAGYIWHWHLIIQFDFLFRILKWILVTAYVTIPILVLGYWFSRRIFSFFSECSPTNKLIISWTLGWAVVIILGMIQLSTGTYSSLNWIILNLVINLVVLFWLLWKRWYPVKNLWNHFFPSIGKNIIGERSRQAKVWNLLVLILLALAFLRALLPPDALDELMYHLAIPQLWEFQHHWWMNADNYHLLFPANMEIIWGYSMATGGLHIPRILTWIFGLLTIMFLRNWLKDNDFNGWIRGISLVFLLLAPMTLITLSINYVEWPLLLWIFVGWWAGRQFVKTGNKSYLILTVVSWGIVLGIKYSAFPVIFILTIEWLVHINRELSIKKAFQAAMVLILAGMVFSGPWLFRNLITTRDPLYPMGGLLFSASTDKGPSIITKVEYLTRHEDLKGLWRWNPWFYHANVDQVSDNRLHFGWPLLHFLVIFLGWRFRNKAPWISIIFLTLILFYFTPAPRIYFPLMGLTWLFLPGFLKEFSEKKFFRSIVTGLMILIMIPSLPMTFHAGFRAYDQIGQDFLMGFIKDETYLHEAKFLTPVMEWIQKNTPWQSQLWAWGEAEIFYFKRWTRPSSPYDIPAFITLVRKSGIQALSAEIKKDNIDYIIINTNNCNLPMRKGKTLKLNWTISDNLGQELDSWIKKDLKPLVRDYRYELYKILK